MDQAFTGAPAEKDHIKFSRYSVFFTSDKYFGIEISAVREVLAIPKITKIPNVSKHVIGIFNLRSTLISLVDFRSLLGLEIKKQNSDMVLLLDRGGISFGILVEKVLDFIEVDNSKIQLPPEDFPVQYADYINGIYNNSDLGDIYLLGADHIINSNEFF